MLVNDWNEWNYEELYRLGIQNVTFDHFNEVNL